MRPPIPRLSEAFEKWVWPARACMILLVLVSIACGGGGGKGSPTTPPPPPPPPPPPGQVTGNLQGSFVGLGSPSTSFAGSQVQLVGIGTTTVDVENRWGFENVPEGVQRLEITGGNHLTRRVQVRVVSGGVNHFDDLDLVESGSFNLSAFDEIWRSFSIPGTIRWNTRPRRVLLDRKSLGALPQGLDWFETEVKQAYNNWLPRNTNDFFRGTPVVKGSIDPLDPDDFDCGDVADGDIVIVGIDECPQDEQFIILGTTTHCFDTRDNEVVLAAIFFNPCTTDVTVDHEIIHTLCAGHLESAPDDSIMGSPGGAGEILPLDRRHMEYVYSRPAAVLSPDDSWGLEILEPVVR